MKDSSENTCCCGWHGDNFSIHHNSTREDDKVHVETSPLMLQAFTRMMHEIEES